MKRIMSYILIAVMLIGMIPFGAFADTATTTESENWSFAGDWAVNADDTRLVLTGLTQNNNATWLEALNMPKVDSLTMNWLLGSISTANTWQEQISFALDGDNSAKLLITLYRYKNGGGNYQIRSRIQYLMNSTWYNLVDSGSESSGNGWKWSASISTEMSDVEVKIVPNTDEKTITVVLTDAVNGAAIDSRTVTASAIGEDVMNDLYTNLLSCQNAYLRVEPRSGSNAALYELTNPVVTPKSAVWDLAENWISNDADTQIELVDISVNGYAELKQKLDLTQSQSITMNWLTQAGSLTTNNTWEMLCFRLKAADTDEYLYVRVANYLNNSGNFQMYLRAQFYNGSWHNITDQWINTDKKMENVNIRFDVDAENKNLQICLTNNDSGTVLANKTVNKSLISDSTAASAMESNILSGTAITFLADPAKGNNSACYVLTNPMITKNAEKSWIEDTNWVANEENATITLTGKTGGTAEWKTPVDLSKGTEMDMNWLTNTTIGSNNSWGEQLYINLVNPETGSYLNIRVARYLNSVGRNQAYVSGYFYTADNTNPERVMDVWGSDLTDSSTLNDLGIRIIRDENLERLNIRLVDNSNAASLSSAVLAAGNFSDSAEGEAFVEQILKCDNLTMQVTVPGNNTAGFTLTNPVVSDYEKELTQNQFTASNADGWQLGSDENGITFTTLDANAGNLIYNASLNVAAGVELSYDVTAVEYSSNCVNSCLWIRDNSTNYGFFMRLRITGGGQHQVRIQSYDGSWTDLVNISSWVSGSMPGNVCKVKLAIDGATITVTLTNTEGTVLGSYTADNLPAYISSMTNGKLYYTTDNLGLYTLSNFKGFPEVTSDDRRSEPFTKAVFAGDMVGGWTTELMDTIEEYQVRSLESVNAELSAEAILAAGGDLIVIAGGTADLLAGKDTATFKAEMSALLAAVAAGKQTGSIVVVTGVPYLPDADVELTAAYNAAIRAIAEENNLLYANIYRAQSQSAWSVSGNSFSGVGNMLVAGEVLEVLFRNCSCLAVNATLDLVLDADAPAEKTDDALNAFKNAATAEDMKAAVENEALGADLKLYRDFTLSVQAKVINALLTADRSGVSSFEQADSLINAVAMQVGLENARQKKEVTPFKTYVAMGDSISYGATAVSPAKDGWVPRFANLISAAQGQKVTLVNSAISGTRMCTWSENGLYPPAIERVDEFVVPYNPDLITTAYGINDFHHGTYLEEFIPTYKVYLDKLIAECPNATIIVYGLCAKGINQSTVSKNGELLADWNLALKTMAEEYGLIYVETYYDMDGVEWLLTDGLHPTNAGYRVIANTMFRNLSAYVDYQNYDVGAQIEKWNITLDDNIAANFYVSMEDAAADSVSISVSVAGDSKTYTASNMESKDGYYVITVELAAAQMTDVITVTMSNGDLSIEKTYTICQYAEEILDGSYDDTTKALVKEMLNYGAAAQTYFGYNTENMVDASRIEGAGAADIDASKASDIVVSGSVDGISFYGASLLFQNRIAVRYYFTVSGDISTYTFIANGKTLTPEQKSGMWYVDVTDILPQNMDAQITVTVNDTLAVTYGPMNYMVRKSENEAESLKLLLKAMYNYHLAAVQYVNKDAV